MYRVLVSLMKLLFMRLWYDSHGACRGLYRGLYRFGAHVVHELMGIQGSARAPRV